MFTGTRSGRFAEAGRGGRTLRTLAHAVLVLVIPELAGRTASTARLVVTVLVGYVRTRRTRY